MHLSAIRLDELALGATCAEAERTHLEACERCRGDEAKAAELRAHFTAFVLPRGVIAKPKMRWGWFAVMAFGLAAAIALLVMWPRKVEQPPELAIKGDATWQLFANRAGQTFAVHDGAPLAAGDSVRFVVTPNGARYVLVVSVDGAGNASIYYPYGGTRSIALAPGEARIELPGSIVLDAAPGPERVFALFSDQPIEAASVTQQLRTIGEGGPAAIRAAKTLAVGGARAQTTLVFEKAAP
ncbi:MAG: DUF4384 domain-containing protein [Kofleriaceae bacterium]